MNTKKSLLFFFLFLSISTINSIDLHKNIASGLSFSYHNLLSYMNYYLHEDEQLDPELIRPLKDDLALEHIFTHLNFFLEKASSDHGEKIALIFLKEILTTQIAFSSGLTLANDIEVAEAIRREISSMKEELDIISGCLAAAHAPLPSHSLFISPQSTSPSSWGDSYSPEEESLMSLVYSGHEDSDDQDESQTSYSSRSDSSSGSETISPESTRR